MCTESYQKGLIQNSNARFHVDHPKNQLEWLLWSVWSIAFFSIGFQSKLMGGKSFNVLCLVARDLLILAFYLVETAFGVPMLRMCPVNFNRISSAITWRGPIFTRRWTSLFVLCSIDMGYFQDPPLIPLQEYI